MSKILTHEHIKHNLIMEKIKQYLLEQRRGASPREIWKALGKKIVKSRATVHNNLGKADSTERGIYPESSIFH